MITSSILGTVETQKKTLKKPPQDTTMTLRKWADIYKSG